MTNIVKDQLVQNDNQSSIQNTTNHTSLSIEKEYIDSMLACSLDDMPPVQAAPEDMNYAEVYGRESIECTVFKLDNMNMAIPSSVISTVLSGPEIVMDDSRLSNEGVIRGRANIAGKSVELIDLYCLVMKGVDAIFNRHSTNAPISNVILLKGCSVGILYDDLLENEIVSQSMVCWRDESSSRVWLAGTVAKMGLLLVDVQGVLTLASEYS